MPDISSRLPKQLSVDLSRSLGAAVRQTGSMENSLQRRLKSATDDLERSLRNYDRLAESLISTTPSQDQVEKIIQDRIPSSYRDKAYKRLFWRTVYKVVPYMQQKKKTEDEINQLSRLSLTSFSVIFRAIIAYSNALLRQSTSDDSNPEDLEEKDPEEFDPELEDAISGMEREVKPSEGKDQVQRKTDQNVKNQQRRSKPVTGVKDIEEFRSYVGQHEGLVDGSRVAIARYSDQLQNALTYCTDRTFGQIQASSLKAVTLGQILTTISTASREALQPGTFIACKSLIAAITATNTVVIQSVALNKSQRAEINRTLKELQQKTQTPQEQGPGQEEVPET